MVERPNLMTPLDVREHLVDALQAELVGPFVPDDHTQGGQEVLPICALEMLRQKYPKELGSARFTIGALGRRQRDR